MRVLQPGSQLLQPQPQEVPATLPQPQEVPATLPQPQLFEQLLQPQELQPPVLLPATLPLQQGLQQEFATKSGKVIP